MRLEDMTVQLRARTDWEAVELGTALVRRDAVTIWKAWLLATLPVFAAFTLLGWTLDRAWLAWPLMLWLKPVFDRIPLYVISRSVFGAAPGVGETLHAQLRWGWKPVLGYLTWRRLGPARSLLMPIEMLEGGSVEQLRTRRRVLGSAAYGTAVLLTVVFACFQVALVVGCAFLVLLFLPIDYLPEAFRSAWSLISSDPPWWAHLLFGVFVWTAVSVIEPFFVGAGFGLYLNRRTQVEAWDVDIAFRRLRARLSAAATPWLLVLCMLALAPPMQAQERDVAPQATANGAEQARPQPPTLPIVFGPARVDDARFRRAAEAAYRDPLLSPRKTVVTWRKKNLGEPGKPADLSWLSGFATVVAFVAEWGLWILLGVVILLLLVTARRWLPWMRGDLKGRQPLPPEVVHEQLPDFEVLPSRIGEAARALWAQGRQRQALSLLYRASVDSMGTRTGIALPPGATEAQCLRASRRMNDGEDRDLFARAVRTWQLAAYAQRLPAPNEFESLVTHLHRRFGWAG